MLPITLWCPNHVALCSIDKEDSGHDAKKHEQTIRRQRNAKGKRILSDREAKLDFHKFQSYTVDQL